MSKKYLVSHFAKKYDVQIEKIESWLLDNLGEIPIYLEAKYNADIAKYLNVSMKSLKNESNKIKVVNQHSQKNNDNKLEIKINNLSKNIFYELIVLDKKKFEYELYKSKDFKIYNSKINEILNKAPRLEEIIKKIENSSYKEIIESIYLDSYEKLKSCLYQENYMQKLKVAYEKLPDLNNYKENCIKKYFSWSDVVFVKNGFKIDPNIAFVFVEIDGPTNILGKVEIKIFEEKYGKKAFKIFINKSTQRVDYTISNDLLYIRDIIIYHIEFNESKKLTQTIASKINKFYNSCFSDINVLNSLKVSDLLLFHENKYLSIISKFLKNEDNILAIWENNKGIYEEALIFIIHRNNFVYYVWENINDNRACYIFKVNKEKEFISINHLKKLINVNIKYKRYHLYNKLHMKFLDITLQNYEVLNHDNYDYFKNRINNILK